MNTQGIDRDNVKFLPQGLMVVHITTRKVMCERTTFSIAWPTRVSSSAFEFLPILWWKMISQCSLIFFEWSWFFYVCKGNFYLLLYECCLLSLKNFFFTPQFKCSLYIGDIRPLSVLYVANISFQLVNFPFDFAYVIFCHTI